MSPDDRQEDLMAGKLECGQLFLPGISLPVVRASSFDISFR
jgi:hypothetical protein